jgi:hypothetical protein
MKNSRGLQITVLSILFSLSVFFFQPEVNLQRKGSLKEKQ